MPAIDFQHNPSIHGRELRALLVKAIPSLGCLLPDDDPVRPQRLMHALFDHATSAIQRRDEAEVIRCFTLTKQLLKREPECDPFVISAIWTSYLNNFRSDDPVGLEVFRGIDPEIRKTLYCPFTYPHTWLRETNIGLAGADQWKAGLTVTRKVEADIRFVHQTCCGHFAIVRLQLEPISDDRGIAFHNCLDDADDVPLVYVEAVVEGVTRALERPSEPKRGMSFLRVNLLRLRHHPVDSRRSDFVTAADRAVQQCIAEAGLVEI